MSTVWRVDAHQHFWRFDPAAYGWIGDDMAVLKRDFLPAELRFELDIRHIGGSVAVQARASEAETDFLLGLASSNPWILGVVGWIDLRAGDLESRLEARASSAVLKGYRHQVQDDPSPSAFLEDGRFNRGVETLQRGGKVYEVLIHAKDLPAAIAFCGRHDLGPLVLDHLGKPDVRHESAAEWARRIAPLAAQEHVSCKLSGLITEAHWHGWDERDLLPYLDAALECFGPGCCSVRTGPFACCPERTIRCAGWPGRPRRPSPRRSGMPYGAATPAACTASAISKRRSMSWICG